jgi:hypothetical protein
MIEELKFYFKNTPREQILADWDKSQECDNVGQTVEYFIKDNSLRFELAELYGYIMGTLETEKDYLVKYRLQDKLKAIDTLLSQLPYNTKNPIDTYKQTIK